MMLDEIIAHKRSEVVQRKRRTPLSELVSRARNQRDPLDFAEAMRGDAVSLIAEIKRASPSMGSFAPALRAESTARIYAENGASAISVLTDERFFSGTLADLTAVVEALARDARRVPVLRKDFVLDAYQVVEAKAHGADAVLLITRVLSDEELLQLYAETRRWRMAALVEVHDEQDIERVLRLETPVVGINSRNLANFGTDLSTFGRLRPLLPCAAIVVAESGIRSAEDVARVAKMGANAMLVGKALITARDVAAKVRELVGGGTP